MARRKRFDVSERSASLPPEPDSRQLLLDLKADVLAEMRALLGVRAPVVLPTLAALAEEFLPRKRPMLADPATFEARMVNHLLPALGAYTAATLRPMHIEDMLRALLAKGLHPQTVNHVRDGGRQLVEFAVDNERWPATNPFGRVTPLRLPEKEYETFSRSEAGMVLRFVDARWRPLFALALYLGPRRGTIFAIRVMDVDLQANVIHFLKTKSGKKIKQVPIPEELRPYIADAVAAAKGELLFVDRHGSPLTRNNKTLNRELRLAMERAGIVRRITFHGLRRVSSSLHQEAGVHPWIVSKILGHSQASLARFGNPVENMTSRYTVFQEQFIREQLNKLSLKP